MNADLLLLGETASLSEGELSASTLRSVKSHLRLLKLNNIKLENQTFLNGTNEVLNSLRDSKGQKLTPAYKQQILFTIKRLFPINDADYKVFKLHRSKNIIPRDFKEDVNKLIDYSLDTFKNFQSDKIVMLEICQVVLFIIATSMRIEEIRQLKYDHLEIIRAHQPVPIKSKHSVKPRLIANSNLLQSIINVLLRTRDIKRDSLPNVPLYKEAILRAQNNYLFYFSTSLIRNKFKEMCVLVNTTSKNLTLNSLRKFTVTMIINRGGIDEAAFLNSHKNANTTVDNYNYGTEQNVENTFANLLGNNIDFSISERVPEPQPYE